MLHLRVTPNKDEIKLYHIEGTVITLDVHTSKLPRLLKGELIGNLYGIKVNSPEEEVKYVTARFKNNEDGELEVTYCYSYNPALDETFTHKVIPFGTFSEDGLSVTSYNDITLTVLNDKSSFKEELLRNKDLSVSKNTIFRCLHSSGDSIKEPTEVHVLKVGDVFAIYNRSYLPCYVFMFIHPDDFTVKEEDSMNSEETTQENIPVKTDPFYLKITEGVDGVYLHGTEGRVIYINLESKYFDSLLKGEFRVLMRGTSVEGDTAGQKYIITFETDQNDQLTMKYSYVDEDIPEVFVSEVYVLGKVAKDRTSVTTKDGKVLKPFRTGETLSNLLLDLEDGESHTRHLLYKHKGSLDFKTLKTNIVKNNSILTINNYFGELITHIHVEDLLQPVKEELTSEVKIDENITEENEMTETNDPTKNMMTAEEARGGSNIILFNTFSHLNDEVGKAVEEGKRFIDVKPNTTIPDALKDVVLKSLREDLGYEVEVFFTDEIRISW